MTQIAKVVHDAGSLVFEINALLATKTAQEMPNIARGLHAQLIQATDMLRGVVDKILAGVGTIRQVMVDADALVALIGVIPDFVAGLGLVFKDYGQIMADMGIGLGDAVSVTSGIADKIGEASNALAVGVEVGEAVVDLVSPTEVMRLFQSLQQLSASLKKFSSDVAAPAPVPVPVPAPA